MRQPIDLVGGFYTDESLPWSCQDTVNYLPVAAEASGTRTPTKLVDAPGLRPFVAIGNTDDDPTAGAPIRGLHDVEGRLFVVSGQMLYEISQKGVAIPRGTIPGVGRVSMAHNQRSHGHELLVVNGSGGYVYNTATDNFTIVTDPGYPGAGVADFLDGYLMQVEPFGRFLFHSDLADALEYNTLDRFEAETQPDRVVGMIVNHQEVWAFGDRTIDVFGNVGTAQGTFQNKGVSISRGCIAKWSPAIIDNGVAWLGDDRVVYHARGYDPVRISTRAIEVALSQCSLADIRNAFSFVWSDRGHSVYYLTVPNGLTFGYDFSTGLWHRRASWHPERDIDGRWCLADLVRSNGLWVGGDFRDGRLYTLDWDYMLEGCDPLIRERVSPVAHVDGRRFSVDSVELLYDTGGSESVCFPFPLQPEGPQISGEAPDGVLAEPYAGYLYSVTEGDAPIASVQIIGGSLPEGLSFSTGEIDTGTPEGSAGSFTITIRVTDTNGLWADHTDTILIACIAGEVGAVDAGPHLLPNSNVAEGPTMAADVSDGIYLLTGGRGLDPSEQTNWSQFWPDVGEAYQVTSYDPDFSNPAPHNITNTGLPVYPNDERIWPHAITADGYAAVRGGNFSGMAIFKDGAFQYATIPFPGWPETGWMYAPSWYSGYDGNGSCWIVGDSVYYGLRQFNAEPAELQALANRIYRWPLDGTGVVAAENVLQVLPWTESGGPLFRYSVSRQQNVYVLRYGDETLTRYNSNLGSPTQLPIPAHLSDDFDRIRNVGVDEAAGMMCFAYLAPGVNTERLHICDMSGVQLADIELIDFGVNANTKILFTGSHIYIQRGNRFFRIPYTPTTCYWRPE